MKPFRTVAPSTEPYDAELTDPRVGQAAWYENNVCAANREAVVAARAAHAMHHGGRHMDGAPRQQPEPETG